MRNSVKRIVLAAVCAAALLLAACSGGSKLPDDYDYDDLSKYIKLGEYKGIEYKAADTSVSDEEVRARIDEDLGANAETIKVESGTVKKDSVVNIDYTGSIDGEEFEGGAAEGVDLDIANSGYIEGFAEGIIGHEVGETFDLNVTFPDDYGKEELAGKPAVFKTTINYISEKKTPEYNEDWVKENTDFSSIKEYEGSVRDELESQKKTDAESSEENQVFSVISGTSEVIEYPEKEYKKRHDQIVESYKAAAEQSGVGFEEYLSANMGMDTDSFNAQVKASSEEAVKTELILHAIADAEGIELTSEGYEEFLGKLLEDAGYTEESFKEQRGISFSEYAEQNNLSMSYLYKTVMTKVLEYSKAK